MIIRSQGNMFRTKFKQSIKIKPFLIKQKRSSIRKSMHKLNVKKRICFLIFPAPQCKDLTK